ncbi:MAG TPA: HopJ type III effector protein [Noviherbaspirillum sp.]|jgi:hypothetical protein|uniref:HopJ type III effector protein n=1 Tax=Noviherbaspirillum sp. TaxID=1926288 RepID=UPI002F95E786
MTLDDFLHRVRTQPATIEFSDTMGVIDTHFAFTPTAFVNGAVRNEAGQNNGSCKLLAFARLHGLDAQQTLACFGAYYRQDVLGSPGGSDHQNIRNFMKTGWDGVRFEADALQPKPR